MQTQMTDAMSIDARAAHTQEDLSRIYAQRFGSAEAYRKKVWQTLVRHFFVRFVPRSSSVLDLGCGYGEFINAVEADKRFAMDLNPDAPRFLSPGITFFHQDCSAQWPEAAKNLDVVFTSNFFEHLPNKDSLGRTIDRISEALRPRGLLIALGPNIRCLNGAYWDFWDHYVPLTERSLSEALVNRGFRIREAHARFLPYTMANKSRVPSCLIRMYLKFPPAWRVFGKQFLVVAESHTASLDVRQLRSSG